METLLFTILASSYLTALAVIDGLFNRLIFREIKDYSYKSEEKKEIYKLPEWKYIGIIFLIIIPLIIPIIVSYYLGGVYFILIYLAIFLLIQWDMIFGKLVFNSWFGDSPSIALPFIGWVNLNIFPVIFFRIVAFIGIIFGINILF